MNLAPDGIERDASSYVDPGGMVFHYEGTIYRALRPDTADFYVSLLNNSTVKPMIGRELVATELTDHSLEGFGAVLRHRTILPLSYCTEWAPEMLRDAALLTLDIGERLLSEGLTLQDAYPWNVQFEGAKPLFIDYTSIVPIEPDLLWRAYGQFCNFFLYPLILYSVGHGDVVRNLLMDYVQGISLEATARLLPAGTVLRRPRLFSQVHLPRFLDRVVQSTGQAGKLNEITHSMTIKPEARVSFFRSLRATIANMRLPISKSQWRDYYSDVSAFLDESGYQAKQKSVATVVEQLKPSTVIDIGANQGGYSIIAGRRGARVVSFDTDESAVSLLYRNARQHEYPILPLVMNAINPTPEFGWRAKQFPSAPDRFKGELALALAVVHHLAFTQRQSFDRIVSAFADFTDKALLTEFVPTDDEMSKRILATNRRDISWYTLENFIAALQKQFTRVELLPSHPEGRTLVLCTR